MNSAIVIFVCALVAMVSAEQYTDRYDTINLQEILGNRRLLVPYILCLLEQGPCTAEGKELKSHIREALEEDCAKCTPAQKKGTTEVIAHLIKNEDAYWQELQAKYDPTGAYYKKHEAELKAL